MCQERSRGVCVTILSHWGVWKRKVGELVEVLGGFAEDGGLAWGVEGGEELGGEVVGLGVVFRGDEADGPVGAVADAAGAECGEEGVGVGLEVGDFPVVPVGFGDHAREFDVEVGEISRELGDVGLPAGELVVFDVWFAEVVEDDALLGVELAKEFFGVGELVGVEEEVVAVMVLVEGVETLDKGGVEEVAGGFALEDFAEADEFGVVLAVVGELLFEVGRCEVDPADDAEDEGVIFREVEEEGGFLVGAACLDGNAAVEGLGGELGLEVVGEEAASDGAHRVVDPREFLGIVVPEVLVGVDADAAFAGEGFELGGEVEGEFHGGPVLAWRTRFERFLERRHEIFPDRVAGVGGGVAGEVACGVEVVGDVEFVEHARLVAPDAEVEDADGAEAGEDFGPDGAVVGEVLGDFFGIVEEVDGGSVAFHGDFGCFLMIE